MLNKHISNIIIGKPIVEDWELLAFDKEDWEKKEKFETIWIEERFLPNILTTEIVVKHFDEKEKVFKDLQFVYLYNNVEEFLYIFSRFLPFCWHLSGSFQLRDHNPQHQT